MAKFNCEIHAPNNKWEFDIDDQETADKLKQAFAACHSFSIKGQGKDYTFNPSMLVAMVFSEGKDNPWAS